MGNKSTLAVNSSCDSYKNKSFNLGDSGDDVINLQQCLRTAGVFNWPTNTGFFGPVTFEALAKFKGNSAPTFKCSDLKNQIWAFGETSSRVQQLQTCMQQSGDFKYSQGATGYFGEVTKAALISWRGFF